jgi:hypothetical protein
VCINIRIHNAHIYTQYSGCIIVYIYAHLHTPQCHFPVRLFIFGFDEMKKEDAPPHTHRDIQEPPVCVFMCEFMFIFLVFMDGVCMYRYMHVCVNV